MQSTGQNSTQTSQPVHPSMWTTASSFAFFFLAAGASGVAPSSATGAAAGAALGTGGGVAPPAGAATPRSAPWRSQGGVGREEGLVDSDIYFVSGPEGPPYKQLINALYSRWETPNEASFCIPHVPFSYSKQWALRDSNPRPS